MGRSSGNRLLYQLTILDGTLITETMIAET
jgi:hypothetical protein